MRAFRFISVLLGTLAFSAAFAETVYTWVDAKGVRHFSQSPPEDEKQQAETVNLETPTPPTGAAERLQNMREVARDLESARQVREEQRGEAPVRPAPSPPVERTVPPVLVVPYPGYPPYADGAPYPPPYPYPYPPPQPKPDRPNESGKQPAEPETAAPSRVLP